MIRRISTHILDTSIGRPAAGVPVSLDRLEGSQSGPIGEGITDRDGRVQQLNPDDLSGGLFRLTFDTATYFESTHGSVFYPQIVIDVALDDDREHYHIPLLTSTFSYSTYLGS